MLGILTKGDIIDNLYQTTRDIDHIIFDVSSVYAKLSEGRLPFESLHLDLLSGVKYMKNQILEQQNKVENAFEKVKKFLQKSRIRKKIINTNEFDTLLKELVELVRKVCYELNGILGICRNNLKTHKWEKFETAKYTDIINRDFSLYKEKIKKLIRLIENL